MVTVDSKGRIVLPSEVRDQLGLRLGSEVEVNTEPERAVVEPYLFDVSLIALAHAGTPVSDPVLGTCDGQ